MAAFGLLFFNNLSLYAAPSALFWYAIPALFTALPFRPAPRRSVSAAPAPACWAHLLSLPVESAY